MARQSASSQKNPAQQPKSAALLEQDENEAPVIQTTLTKKRGREPDKATVDSQPTATKKAKVTAEMKANVNTQQTTRQSGRTIKAKPTLAPKRKRRTKAEIEADKAAEAEAKRQLKEEAREVEQQMVQMDIDEDMDRAARAANIVRKLSDISESEEEFVGYNEVSSTESDASKPVEESEEDLKVSKFDYSVVYKPVSP